MNKLFIFIIAITILIVPNLIEARSNCTDNSTGLLFKYRVPVFNVTVNGSYIPITYAACNVTVFKQALDVDNYLNTSLMVNFGSGLYDCWIDSTFKPDKYATFYQCVLSNDTTVQNYGSFEVIDDQSGWQIMGVISMIGIVGLLILFSYNMEEEHGLLKMMFIGWAIMLSIPIITSAIAIADEENAAVTIMTQASYQVYTWLIYAFIAYVAIYLIYKISLLVLEKRRLKDA
jgi:hypothetical protein